MIVTITGANQLLIKDELARRRAAFIAEHGDFSLEDIDAEDTEEMSRLIDAVQGVPFLASRKLVILRRLSVNKPLAEKVEALIERCGDSTDVIFYEPGIDKRGSVYKTLKKRTELLEFQPLDARGLAGWLVEAAKARGGTLSFADASYLVERLGNDQLLASNELDKLLAYDMHVTRTSIEQLTIAAPQSRVFDLLDAAFAGRTEQVLKLYDEQRSQGVDPQQILALIGWQLHILALVAAAGNRTTEQIAKEALLSPFVVQKSARIATRLDATHIRYLVAQALDMDLKSKTSAFDLDEGLRTFLVALDVKNPPA